MEIRDTISRFLDQIYYHQEIPNKPMIQKIDIDKVSSISP